MSTTQWWCGLAEFLVRFSRAGGTIYLGFELRNIFRAKVVRDSDAREVSRKWSRSEALRAEIGWVLGKEFAPGS